MIQKISCLIVASMLALTLHAQENPADEGKPYDFKHAVGANLGETTGVGLAYRYSFDRFSAQLAFWPVVEHFEYDVNLRASLSFYYRLREYEHVNLLLYQGNEYQYRKRYSYCSPGDFICPLYVLASEQSLYSTSLGFGFEFLMGKHLSLNLMLGYAAMDNFTSLKVKGESGLFFHF
ncbi:MAG: hypothetical protein ACQES0_04105 [Bacteroidota bacterium]